MYRRCKGWRKADDDLLLSDNTSVDEAYELGLLPPEPHMYAWLPDLENGSLEPYLENFRLRWPDYWAEGDDASRGPSPQPSPRR